MAKDLDELRSLRPGNRSAIDSHKKRMLEETVAYRLRELRERNGLSQVQLADLMQVSQNRVSRIENGDIERSQVDTLRKYVEALGGKLHLEIALGDQLLPLA